MTAPDLKDRLARIAAAFSGRSDLGFRDAGDLEALVEDELGSLDVFGGSLRAGGSRRRVVAPKKIYHVLASNLAVSAETSLLLGLMLGSGLVFKLPGGGLPEFEAAVEKLPENLRARVKLARGLDEAEMKACEAVVVYGSNETVDFFRGKLGRNQRALFYGHRISLGILEKAAGEWRTWAGRAAEEVCAYGQQGCLSPQFYLAESRSEAGMFAELLAEALAAKTAAPYPPGLSFEEAAQRRHARRLLRGRGAEVRESDKGAGFTVALLPDANFIVGPGGQFVQVGAGGEPQAALAGWKGAVSSISLAVPAWPPPSGRWEELAAELGASRLCRMGDLQKPPLAWRHDGRPRLGDLVTWISLDR